MIQYRLPIDGLISGSLKIMPISLEVLVTTSVIAIGLIAVLLHWLGLSQTNTLKDRDEAKQLFQDTYPEAEIAQVQLTNGRTIAIMNFESGCDLGLIQARGSKWQSRMIRSGDIKRLIRRGPYLDIKFQSFADPKVILCFENGEQLEFWIEKLKLLLDNN